MIRHTPRDFPAGYRLTQGDADELSKQATSLFNSVGGGGTRVQFAGDRMQIIGKQSQEWAIPAIALLCENIGTVPLLALDAVQMTWPLQEQDLNESVLEGIPILGKDAGETAIAEGDTIGIDHVVKTKKSAQCRQPLHSAFGRFGVVAGAQIEPGHLGPVWFSGIMPCRLWFWRRFNVVDTESDRSLPDRCDTMMNRSYLQASYAGAGQILWFAYPEVQTDDPRLAVIKIDSRNTKGLGIAHISDDEDHENNNGIAEVIEMPPEVKLEGVDHSDPRLAHGIIRATKIP